MSASSNQNKRRKTSLQRKIISAISTPLSFAAPAPPMSAVAARRAAVLAASSVVAPSSHESATSEEEDENEEEDEEIDIIPDEDEAVTTSKTGSNTKGKRKEKSVASGRYFNGVEEDEAEDENKIMPQGESEHGEGQLDLRYIPPPKVKMGRGKRSRREKR
jgi:hypothetical protein